MYKLIDFIVLLSIYFFILYPRFQRYPKSVFLKLTIFFVYLVFVLYLTLMPICFSMVERIIIHYQPHINLVPFIDVVKGHGDYLRQILLNVLLTIPFGFLWPLINHKQTNLLKTTIATFWFSFLIELAQLAFAIGRSFDITDILTNTCGGMIGYMLYQISMVLLKKIHFKRERS